MSESSESSNSSGRSSGESPGDSYSSQRSSSSNRYTNPTFNDYEYYRPGSVVSTPVATSSTSTTSESKKVKRFLKETEDFIVAKLEDSPTLKKQFLKTFRNIVLQHEVELMKFPNISFFTEKFKPNAKYSEAENRFNEIIVQWLYEKEDLDKQKKSNLKYW